MVWTNKLLAAQQLYYETRNFKTHSPYTSNIFTKRKQQYDNSNGRNSEGDRGDNEDTMDENIDFSYCEKHRNIYQHNRNLLQNHKMHIIDAIAETHHESDGRIASKEWANDDEVGNELNAEEEVEDDKSEDGEIKKKERTKSSRNRSKQRGSEIGLLEDDEDSTTAKMLASKKRNKHQSTDNPCLFKGCGAFKSRYQHHDRLEEKSPHYYNNNLFSDAVDSFSVMRFDIHERRAAVHEDSVHLPASLNALVSQNMPAYTTNIQVFKKNSTLATPKFQQHSASFKFPQQYKRNVIKQIKSTKSNVDLSKKHYDSECDDEVDNSQYTPSYSKINTRPSSSNLLTPPNINDVYEKPQKTTSRTTIENTNDSIPTVYVPMKQQLRATSSVPLNASLPRPRATKQPHPMSSTTGNSETSQLSQNNIFLEPPKSHPRVTSLSSTDAVPVDALITIEPLDDCSAPQQPINHNLLNTSANNVFCNKALSTNQLNINRQYDYPSYFYNEKPHINDSGCNNSAASKCKDTQIDLSEYDPLKPTPLSRLDYPSTTAASSTQMIKNSASKDSKLLSKNIPRLLPPPPLPRTPPPYLVGVASNRQPVTSSNSSKTLQELTSQRSSSLRCKGKRTEWE